jgi:DnaJ-class molecular chaperone
VTDHYHVLGVAANATLADIKAAYRRKASQAHPDKNPGVDMHKVFQSIQQAYELLSDPVRREAYDDNRRRGLIDNPIDVASDLWHHYLSQFAL